MDEFDKLEEQMEAIYEATLVFLNVPSDIQDLKSELDERLNAAQDLYYEAMLETSGELN